MTNQSSTHVLDLNFINKARAKGMAGVAITVALISFVGVWFYAFSFWGFYPGLVLGWIPAAVLAFVLGSITAISWPFLLLAGLIACIGWLIM